MERGGKMSFLQEPKTLTKMKMEIKLVNGNLTY